MKKFNLFLVLMMVLSFSPQVHAINFCNVHFFKKIFGVKPFAQAFSSKNISGPIEQRMDDFVNRWPNNVKKVDKVHIKADMGNGNRPLREQDFYVISLNNLDETQKQEFLSDYLNTLAENTLSFPLGSGAGHLYTRVGSKTLDHLSGVSVKEYILPNSDRLETVIKLDNEEFDNLKWYVENATTDYKNTIGNFTYDGTNQTVGTLKNNKCTVGKGHNCTSWIGYAPIGVDGQPLTKLINAGTWDIARNPGWLTSYIHAYTGKERFPFAIYMSQKPMEELDQIVKSGSELNWDYNLH